MCGETGKFNVLGGEKPNTCLKLGQPAMTKTNANETRFCAFSIFQNSGSQLNIKPC
jgi:hypothetical protein